MRGTPELQSVSNAALAESAVRCVYQLATALGGAAVYLSRGNSLTGNVKRVERDGCIKAEFDGCNYRDLARRYQVSEMRIRQIVNATSHDKSKAKARA